MVSAQHPFILRLFQAEESYLVRIYIWNLTHGGGAKRPANEYRIQVTGIDNTVGFDADNIDKVLILGWWDEGDVFAGFDWKYHVGRLGNSPSIQIREEGLRKAVLDGIGAIDKGNGEIAIAFRPEFFGDYMSNMKPLHGFGDSPKDLFLLEEAINAPHQVNDAVLNELSIERQTIVKRVTKLLRDSSFRNRVLVAYGNRCAFCGLQLRLVDAAHIVPVGASGNDDTANGLALCALHHRAFDCALLTLNEKYQVLVNESALQRLRFDGLNGGEKTFVGNLRGVIHAPPSVRDRPNVEYVKRANTLRGWDK